MLEARIEEARRPRPDAPSGGHRVSAVYPTREEAVAVRQRLIDAGIASSAVEILHDRTPEVVTEDSDDVLKDMVVDGTIGTAIGTGVGALGTVALWASGVTLFVASPVIAPLAMLGWFAGVGGLVGAAAGAAGTGAPKAGAPRKEGKFSELVMDAIKSGNAVLVASTYDEAERGIAMKVIGESLKGRDQAAEAE